MAADPSPNQLLQVVGLLGAAVAIVPLFRRLGLGSVLGYLMAGLLIGPFGFGWFSHPEMILHIAELGVVMFLFVIGLEMRPSHLWGLRREIFGLGSLQILFCTGVLTMLGQAFGFSLAVSFVGSMGFVLTSTAIVMQILGERGDIALPRGQKIVSILLFEDLLIVPLLAVIALMSPDIAEPVGGSRWLSSLLAVGAVAVVIASGVWLLNPLFRLLALARAREVMTAAALLVVLGAALLMQLSGLSMAMGAFLAGVLLAESSFRHQIEADIEPFRGILLGLFFMGVGMSLDFSIVAKNSVIILSSVVLMMTAKAVGIYAVARLAGSMHSEALDRATLMAQGGEFAFVFFAAASAAGVINAEINANLTAIVILSMALTPLAVIALKRLKPGTVRSAEGTEAADGLSGSVLIIGFGRFGQVMSQILLARDVDVTIIDYDPDMIKSAGKFGFKVYFGDGGRLDVLRASGAGSARAIAVCVDGKENADHIVELARAEFPQAKLLVRAFDRVHARNLIQAGVDFQMRETFESALIFGQAALRELGAAEEEIQEIAADIRRRDADRFALEIAGQVEAGKQLMHGNLPKPTPLIPPKRETQILGGVIAEPVS